MRLMGRIQSDSVQASSRQIYGTVGGSTETQSRISESEVSVDQDQTVAVHHICTQSIHSELFVKGKMIL